MDFKWLSRISKVLKTTVTHTASLFVQSATTVIFESTKNTVYCRAYDVKTAHTLNFCPSYFVL